MTHPGPSRATRQTQCNDLLRAGETDLLVFGAFLPHDLQSPAWRDKT